MRIRHLVISTQVTSIPDFLILTLSTKIYRIKPLVIIIYRDVSRIEIKGKDGEEGAELANWLGFLGGGAHRIQVPT